MPCYVHEEFVSVDVLWHSQTGEQHMEEALDKSRVERTFNKFQVSYELLILSHLVAFKELLFDKLEQGSLFLIKLFFSHVFLSHFFNYNSA
jgi:uncharacterized protein YhjY with autotransporter beta-barrel domain